MQIEEKTIDNTKAMLYSRQIGTYGGETMEKLSSLTILILGLRGNGIEVAKNIILSGVKKVFIYDTTLVSINDLGSNFFLEEKDLNRRRDESVIEKLIDLNPYIEIEILNKLNDNDDLIELLSNEKEKINVIIQTEIISENKIIKLSNYCHENNIAFIYGGVSGLNAFIFSDLGKQHIITDIDGIEYQKYHCKNITNDKNAIISFEEKNFNININDVILIKYVEGMSEINDMKNIKVISKNDDKSIVIDTDTINFGKYVQGGIVCKIKQPIIKNYKPYQDIINIPFNRKSKEEYISKNEESEEILYNTKFYLSIYMSLGKYLNVSNNILPNFNDTKEFSSILEESKIIFEKMKSHDKEIGLNFYEEYSEDEIQKFDEKKAMNIISLSRAEISPMCSLIGGYISQEIIKCTGKYEPIDQWYFFDLSFITENIPKNIIYNNSRYDEMLAVFGNDIQKKLADTSLFIIGAGAIGCEVLKNFAMMGISTNENKCSYITDDDNIQLSNLNRQFLFRQKDISKSKSLIAVNAVKKMNNDFNCEALQYRVNKDTKNIFNKKFWSNLNMVIFAVDNINAREYLNEECHKYSKSFIDSGTDGTKGKVNTIIPFITEPLKISHKNQKMETTHSCTLKYFATSINDCIDWAKENFNNLFYKEILIFKNFINDPEKFIQKLNELPFDVIIEKCEIIKKFIQILNNENDNEKIIKIIEKSLEYFNEFYNTRILEILKKYPENKLDKDGKPFWNAIKRKPKPLIEININEPMTKLFILSFMNILSNCLGIEKININIDILNDIIKNYKIPNKNIIIYNEEEKSKIIENKINQIKKYKEIILKIKEKNKNIHEEIFEKDNINNYHIEFIQSSSNLRAQNFYIEQVDKNKILMIAGNVIKAIPTSTASVAGYLSLQLIALLNNGIIGKNIKDAIFDLSSNIFAIIEDLPKKYIKTEIEIDNEINESISIQELVNYMKNNYNIETDYFSINGTQNFTRRKFKKGKCKEKEYQDYQGEIKEKIEDYFDKKSQEKSEIREYILEIIGNLIDDKKKTELKIIKYKPIR